MIVAYIEAHRRRFGVEPICRVLSAHGMQIAPSTYYAALKQPVSAADLADAYRADALVDLFRAHRRVYGVRKLWHLAGRAGLGLGRDQVARLMGIAGIAGVVRGHHTTTTTRPAATSAPRQPDLIDRAWDAPTAPDQWWVADFTYVWTLSGFCYTALVTDVYSRRILGWRVATSMATPLVTATLDQALSARRRGDAAFTPTGVVHHSDAGSQYTSLAFTDQLIAAGIAGSIGSVGDALDNALMESTIGLYKTELIDLHPRSWIGRGELERETASWVHWFNTSRLHSSIHYCSPVEWEQHYHQRTTTTASALEAA